MGASSWWSRNTRITSAAVLGIVGLTVSGGCGSDGRRVDSPTETATAPPPGAEGRGEREAPAAPPSEPERDASAPPSACPSEADVVAAEAELERRRRELTEACRLHDPEACALSERSAPPDARADPLSSSPASAEPFTIPRAVVEEALAEHAPAIRACHRAALRCGSSLPGQVTMRFAIDRYGRARHPLPVEPVEDAGLALCLRHVLLLARFPEPDVIGIPTVRHTFAAP